MHHNKDLRYLLDEVVVILFDLLGLRMHQLIHIADPFLKFLNPLIWP